MIIENTLFIIGLLLVLTNLFFINYDNFIQSILNIILILYLNKRLRNFMMYSFDIFELLSSLLILNIQLIFMIILVSYVIYFM